MPSASTERRSRSTTSGDGRLPVTAGLLAAVLLATHAAHWLLPELFGPLAAQVTDRLFTLRSSVESLRPVYDDTVVHVTIDDRSLREIGNYYLGRVEHAQLVRGLGRAGVAAQIQDFIFAAPTDPEGDAELERETAAAGNVYYGMAARLGHRGEREEVGEELDAASREILARDRWHPRVRGDAGAFPEALGHFLTYPRLAAAARGLGLLNIQPDRDGVYRRVTLLVRDRDGFLPSLALRVICDYLDVPPERLEIRPGRAITLRGARRPGSESATEIVVPIDRQGRMVVNYVGPWGTMTHYPFSVIYEAAYDRFMMEDLRTELEGKLAVVSWTTTGAGDIGAVPTDPLFPLSGIHANVIHSILTRDFLRELSGAQMLGWVELPGLLLLLLASLRLRTIPFVFAAAGLVLAYHAVVILAFLYGNLILNVPRPVIALVGSTVVVAAYHYHREAKARAVLRSTFDAYFPPSVVDKIMAHSARLVAAAQKKELTILFSDIKGFTGHTSTMEAGRVRALLNEYFERMIEIVFRHEGTLDKFIGDGLMVFFGDPETQSDHAVRGVRTAVEMQLAARELSAEWSRRGEMPLEIRVGINTGEVIVGNMGSSKRLSYTVLGEPVNLAQRLEAAAPPGGVLISERTYELARGSIAAQRRDPIRVKGFEQSISVYEVPVEAEAARQPRAAGTAASGAGRRDPGMESPR